MKKKIMVALMGTMMLVSVPALVSAASEDQSDQKEMKVKYELKSSWELSIPAAVTLSTDKETSVKITANKMNMAADKQLNVKIVSGLVGNTGQVKLKWESNNLTQVTSNLGLTSGGDPVKDAEPIVAVFKGQSTTPEEGGTLYFSPILEKDVRAGTYTETINFQIIPDVNMGVTIDPEWGETGEIEF